MAVIGSQALRRTLNRSPEHWKLVLVNFNKDKSFFFATWCPFTYQLTCTLCHHCHRYSINYHQVRQRHSYCAVMSCLVRPSSVRHVDQISPPMLDNCLNRSHQGHKYNYPQRPIDSIYAVCSLSDTNSTHRLMCHIVQSWTSNWHHHIHHQHKLIHRMNKFPSTTVSFPSVLCTAMHLSLDYNIQLLRDP